MRKLGIFVLAVFGSSPGMAETVPAEVQACLRANLPEKTVQQTMELVSSRGDSGERELRAELYATQPEPGQLATMIDMQAPADMAGARYLVLQNGDSEAVYVYLPALRRVRRITGSQQSDALWGTDFSYADLKQIQGMVGQTPVEFLPLTDADAPGRHRFSVQPPADSPYSRIEIDIHAASCLPTQVLFFDRAGAAFKRLTSVPESFVQSGERWLYSELNMENLRENSQTRVRLSEVQYDERISPALFRPNSFHFGAR